MTTPKVLTPEEVAAIRRRLLDKRKPSGHWAADRAIALCDTVDALREALRDALLELMDAVPFGAGLDLEGAGVSPRRARIIRRAAALLGKEE